MGAQIDQKSIKNVINLGRHLDIDFWPMLVDFGSQVGVGNPPKVDPKGCSKTSIFLRASNRWPGGTASIPADPAAEVLGGSF